MFCLLSEVEVLWSTDLSLVIAVSQGPRTLPGTYFVGCSINVIQVSECVTGFSFI